ncbi:MAG: DUF4912 domain-containing protein [Drouetiella hepatica Uher 2000/2452]|jgi:phosphate transport system substrate-binding protein|uniref:DUF4912 domain-containing protein n=1 Tax=Drouetiella hepatica Uher 2000/2452 TaxID=904376 RepID=A0A951UMN0_9CYAN|nr:DUF4912 domain-containing protein [Drouetiella hepatica Uher 2000/2452]
MLFVLAATPTFLVSSLRAYPLLAQSAALDLSVPTSVPSGTAVKIDGSSSMATINQALKQRFETQFPGTKVEVGYGGTDLALQSVLEGKNDLAAIGRTLTDAEKAQGLTLAPVSRNKIAILVGAGNPFNGSLTVDQFAKIFRGEITDWSEVGGAPGAIRMIDRPETSDTRRAFLNYPSFQSAPFQSGANATTSEDSTEAVIGALGNDGIGYAIVNQATGQSNVRIVLMHDTLPTDPRYPFSQPLSYAYKADLNPGARAFLGYAIAPENQQSIETAQAASPALPSPIQPAPNAAVSPAPDPTVAASPTVVASPTASPSTAAIEPNASNLDSSSNAGWLWLLALPLLGGLWWLLKPKAEPVAPLAAPVTPAPPVHEPLPDSRIILAARDCKNAYAYWEVPDETKAELRRHDRQLKLRLYDVTDSHNNYQTQQIQQLDCHEPDQDLPIAIPVDDRDYLVELGYLTDDRWLKLAHSAPVRVPACPVPENRIDRQVQVAKDEAFAPRKAAVIAGTATAATLAVDRAVSQRRYAWTEPDHQKSQIILVPRTPKSAYAYWELSQADQEAARRQGAEKMALRIYEVTNLDREDVSAHSMQQFECDERDRDRHVPIPISDRNYVAEIGYITGDGRWLRSVRSQPVRVPAL